MNWNLITKRIATSSYLLRIKNVWIFTFFLCSIIANAQQKTYCNPVNIDYAYTPFPANTEGGKHRATADPVIVNFKSKNYVCFKRFPYKISLRS